MEVPVALLTPSQPLLQPHGRWSNVCTLHMEHWSTVLGSHNWLHLCTSEETDSWKNPNIFLRNTVPINCLCYCVVFPFIIDFHWQTVAKNFTMANNMLLATASSIFLVFFVIKIKESEGSLPFITRSKISLPFPWEERKKEEIKTT